MFSERLPCTNLLDILSLRPRCREEHPVGPPVMRAGEVGRLIVPYDAGYGPGLSLYGTRKAGLKTRWVPSGETLRYEVELLRCRDVGGKFSGDGARVCCSDKKFPCPGPDTDGGDAEMTRK